MGGSDFHRRAHVISHHSIPEAGNRLSSTAVSPSCARVCIRDLGERMASPWTRQYLDGGAILYARFDLRDYPRKEHVPDGC